MAEVLHTLNGAEGPYEFGHASSVDFGPDKSVVVADRLQHEVLVFDSLGNLYRSIGRPGEGPGELQSPTGLGVYGDSTIAVVGGSRGLDAVRVFSWDGSPVESWRVAINGQTRPWLGTFVDNPRAIVDWHFDWTPGEPMESANTVASFPLKGRDVLVPDESLVLPYHHPSAIPISGAAAPVDSVPHPYSRARLWSVGTGRLLAYVSQDSTELIVQEVFDRGRAVLSRIYLPVAGGGGRLADRERTARYLHSWQPDAQIGPIDPILLLPVYGVYVDDSERIWVNTTPLFEITEGHGAAHVMVFQPGDTLFDVVSVPSAIQPHAPHFRARGDRAIAVTQDALDRDVVYV